MINKPFELKVFSTNQLIGKNDNNYKSVNNFLSPHSNNMINKFEFS